MSGAERRAGAGGVAFPLRGDRVLGAVLGLVTVSGLWLTLAPVGTATRLGTYWGVQVFLDAFMLVASRRVASTATVAAVSRFWGWLARAGLLFVAGDLVQTWATWRSPGSADMGGGTAHAVLIGSGIAVMVVVILTHPSEFSGAQRRRVWLDAATVAAGVAAYLWYLNAGSAGWPAAVLSGVTLVSAFGLAKLALSAHPPFTRGAAVVGIAGVMLTGVMSAFTTNAPDGALQGTTLFLGLMPSVAIAVTPRVQELRMRAAPDVLVPSPRHYSMLPYLAVAACQALLVVVVVRAPEEWSARTWGVLFGNILVVLLVVVRQLGALHENASLLSRLDESVLALRHAEQRFRSLVHGSADLILVCDHEGTISYASPAALHMTGVGDADLLGRGVQSFLHPDSLPAFLAHLAAPGRREKPLVCRLQHADGSSRWAEVSLTDLTENPAVSGIMMNVHDITERRRLEIELRHAQKMESVGQLAAGIAHEINTPIQFIGNNITFLGEAFDEVTALLAPDGPAPEDSADRPAHPPRDEPDESVAELLAEIPQSIAETLDGVARVTTIVRAMKTFGHPGTESKTLNDLNEVVRSTLVVAAGELRDVAEVETELPEDLPHVWCSRGDINQVVLILVVNAAHAMQETRAATGRRGRLTVRTRQDGPDALIEVRDTGPGIPAEIAPRIFDQFFTTKAVGHGTGQGLAVAHTLVHERHHGTITFTTEPGEGTTFTVRLPVPTQPHSYCQ